MLFVLLRMKLNPNLKSWWKTKAQIRVLYGGRMSSKSYDVAGILIYLASNYKLRILCIRRYQNKIDILPSITSSGTILLS